MQITLVETILSLYCHWGCQYSLLHCHLYQDTAALTHCLSALRQEKYKNTVSCLELQVCCLRCPLFTQNSNFLLLLQVCNLRCPLFTQNSNFPLLLLVCYLRCPLFTQTSNFLLNLRACCLRCPLFIQTSNFLFSELCYTQPVTVHEKRLPQVRSHLHFNHQRK